VKYERLERAQRDTAAAYLEGVVRTLSGEADLSPANPKVTRLLSDLVERLREWHAQGFGGDLPDAPEFINITLALPPICARAESEMEKWWAERLIAAPGDIKTALRRFWYYGNYRSLIHAEWDLIGGLDFARIVFLGGGALPLTAMLLAAKTDRPICCVDRDGAACALARRLIERAGLRDRVTICEGLAENARFGQDDLALCASLLQGDAHYAGLAAAKVRFVLARDSDGVFRFCYRPAPAPPAR
jgi:hypothetical protein